MEWVSSKRTFRMMVLYDEINPYQNHSSSPTRYQIATICLNKVLKTDRKSSRATTGSAMMLFSWSDYRWIGINYQSLAIEFTSSS